MFDQTSRSNLLSLIAQSRQSESTLTYKITVDVISASHEAFYYVSPAAVSETPISWPNHTKRASKQRKGAQILLLVLQPLLGQELAVTMKIYGAQRQGNPSHMPSTLPHSQEENLFEQ